MGRRESDCKAYLYKSTLQTPGGTLSRVAGRMIGAMLHMANPMAQAWLAAARDLNIRVEHPFIFTSRSGINATTQGIYLPDFGSPSGALITCRFDTDAVHEAADDTDYFQSALSPHHYEPYDRSTFIDTLEDWGWFGNPAEVPSWFNGGLRRHGGAA